MVGGARRSGAVRRETCLLTPSPSFTEVLANLSVSKIVIFVAVATLIRLILIRVNGESLRWLVELVESALVAVVLVYMLIRPFVVQAYFIPSPSMEPTLLGNNGIGDRILVNKMVYRVSTPKRGDVVVFIPPANATEGTDEEEPGVLVNYIKRLVGEPGDVLVVHAGRVIINHGIYSHQAIRDALAQAGVISSPDQADHHIRFTPDGVCIDGTRLLSESTLATILTNDPGAKVTVIPGYTERNGRRVPDSYVAEDPDYDMKLYQGQPLKADYANNQYLLDGTPIDKTEYDKDNQSPPGPVPAGHFFMMGDNRNDSEDSTFWGPLDGNRVVGKAEYIFWPLDRVRAIH
jgi:signal peptidase I